jgi:hypothetical protein
MNTLGGGAASEVQQREDERIVATFADPSTWVLRELLHACWGRRAGQGAQRLTPYSAEAWSTTIARDSTRRVPAAAIGLGSSPSGVL